MLVEIRWSANGDDPDQKGGQHTNVSILWARFGEGPWRRVRNFRSQHRLLKDLEELLGLEKDDA